MMTIELSQEELTKYLEIASRYGGTLVREIKTTDGDEILLVVPQRKPRTRQPKAAAQAGPVDGPVDGAEAAYQRLNAAADK